MSLLLDQALKLPVTERRKLADDIYDSIVSEPDDLALNDEEKNELERRLADFENHPDKVVAWEDVRERLRKVA